MPFTLAQLRTNFQNANAGTASDAAQTLALTAISNQNNAGTLTDAAALSQTIALAANSTTSVSVQAYTFFVGTAPSTAGLTFLNAAYVGTGAQSGLNGENRFIAQSVSLALQNPAAKTAFTTSYGSLTVEAATRAAYNVIVGNQAATAAGINVESAITFLSSAASVTYFTNFVRANVPGLSTGTAADIDLAVKAAIVGEIMYNATVFNNGAGVGSYATATNNLLKDLADDGALVANNVNGINLFTSYGTTGTATPGTVGTSQALKVGLDSLVGTANDDTFVGTVDAVGVTATTVNLGDSIDGGAGTDTLTVISNVTGGAATVAGLSLKNVENVTIQNSVAAGAGNVITADATGLAGVTKISAAGTGNVTVTNIGSATLGVAGTITNGTVGDAVPTANTLVTQTITAAGATSVDVTGATQNTFGNLAINTAGGTGTSMTLRNTSGTAATVSTLTLGAPVTTLNVAATSAISLQGVYTNTVFANNGTSVRDGVGVVETTANTLATITASGPGAVSLGTIASTGLKTIDASASAGAFSGSFASAALTSVKGSTGADTLTLTGALTATAVVDLGTGNDTLTLGAVPTAGATINGGDGTDVLGLAAAALFTTTTKAQFTNFEAIALSGTANYDATLFTGFTAGINIAGGTVTLTNVAAAPTFNVTAGNTSFVVTLANAAGTADVVNLNLGSLAAATPVAGNTGALSLVGVETLNVNSLNVSSATGIRTNALTIDNTNTSLKQVVITGAGQTALTVTAITQALNVDASAATGGLNVITGATKTLNVIGTSANDTINASTVGGQINAGKGGDAITAAAGADVIILKAGDSVYDATVATSGVVVGVAPATTGRSTMDTITNFTAGADKIDLTQIAGFVGAAQGVATSVATDAASVTLALAGANLFKDGGGLVRGVAAITATAGTFVAIDVNHDGIYTAAADMVVLLVTPTGVLTNTDFNFGS